MFENKINPVFTYHSLQIVILWENVVVCSVHVHPFFIIFFCPYHSIFQTMGQLLVDNLIKKLNHGFIGSPNYTIQNYNNLSCKLIKNCEVKFLFDICSNYLL